MIIDIFRKKSSQEGCSNESSQSVDPNDSIDKRLNKHPQLKARVEALLDVVENADNDLEKASQAEQKVRDEIQQMGQQVLADWADKQAKRVAEEFQQAHTDATKHGQKQLYWHTTFGLIQVMEQLYLQEGCQKRPFSLRAEVQCRGYSLPLQRAMTDFGADNSFASAEQKMKEHYGINLGASSIQKITEKHASQIENISDLKEKVPEAGTNKALIVETDGSFVPIVATEDVNDDEINQIDRRKTRSVGWKEARLCLSHPQGSCTPVFGGTIGTPEQVGKHLLHTAIEAGLNQNSPVHAVGDGASWIVAQVDEVFGKQASYLIDFYHLCDYLAAAAKACAPSDTKTWFNLQKKRMKNEGYQDVIGELETFLEPNNVPDDQAPVRCCHRYLQNRPGQFAYRAALDADLPIGSGEVESSHRYIIQKRLKLSGAWWKIDNARAMLALRLLRANNQWQEYWESLMPLAA